MKIDFDTLSRITKESSFENDGDLPEQRFGRQITNRFPKCEEFWRLFIVPMTNRVDLKINKTDAIRIRKREQVDDSLYEIAIYHYSAFIKLVYAYDHLNNLRTSSFVEFYTHLGSCCDIIEDLIVKIYDLYNECTGKESEILKKLSKTKFIKLAKEWYDESYNKAYEHYLSKGKYMTMPLPKRDSILDEYFGKSKDWKSYYKFAYNGIRPYRNVLIHSSIIGNIWTLDSSTPLVPKKEKIGNYKKLIKVLKAVENIDRIKHDFFDMRQLMTQDIQTIQDLLNKLWNKPIKEMNQLLYIDKNEKLLSKYGLEIK